MASRSRKRVSDDFIDDEPSRIKKSKNNAAPHAKASAFRNRREDTNGDSYWEISKMRRVTISSFRGKTMVNIREYYEKDGKEHPGKKGISLPVDQFSALMTLLPDIETALQEKGVSIPRPNYAAQGAASGGDGEGEEEEEDSTDELSAPGTTRRNIEATSDEDDEEE
ncbi:transcriptional Coactivator p15-domain-containing protein [Aspergillus pseudoustus]|uniref:Transcriptional Coactivator p15-domain-containing protein n=1 Tax=Aspergillus pseudoustus TaxID=1810923 RepID=A0ABR4JSE7_9EURO